MTGCALKCALNTGAIQYVALRLMTIPAGFSGVESVQASFSGLHSGDNFHENGLSFGYGYR